LSAKEALSFKRGIGYGANSCVVRRSITLHRRNPNLRAFRLWNYFLVFNIAVPPGGSFLFFGNIGEAVREALHE